MAVVLIAQTEEVQALVRTATAELGAKKLLGAIGFGQLRWIDRQFKSEGRAPGSTGAWAPLRPNTVAGRRKGRGTGAPRILRDTGRMAQSFAMETREAQLAVEVGTPDPRATWHHFGTRPYTIRPKRGKVLVFPTVNGMAFARAVNHPGLPARPMLPPDGQASRMAEDVLRAIVAKIDRAHA